MSLVLQDELLISPKTKEQVIQNTADIRAIEEKIKTGVYKFKGTVEKYSDLPKENVEIGDVYNIKSADKKHGILAGDNVCWDGEDWDNLGSFIDLEPYALVADLELEINNRKEAINSVTEDLNKEIQDRAEADSDILSTLDTAINTLNDNLDIEESARIDSDTSIENKLTLHETDNNVKFTAINNNLDTKATKAELNNEQVARETFDTNLLTKIWSKNTLDSGYFKTVNTQADTSYSQLWNENSGGGVQFYNNPRNRLSFVGVNKSSDSDEVDVQIYSKDKTSNIGTRINVSATKGMFYLKDCKNLGFPEEREVVVKEDLPTKTSELTNDSDYTTNAELQAQVTALTQQIKDLKALIPTEVFTVSEAKTALNKTGKVTLYSDIDLDTYAIVNGTFANYSTIINLNGYKIEGAPKNGRSIFMLRGSTNYTFNGNGIIEDKASDSSCIWTTKATNNATINSGTWIAEHSETIYCELGTITINNGIFKTNNEDKRYLLNCKDANFKAGTASIIVKGGEFWDFDPSANPEGQDTSYVADGYTVISREEDGHVIYTVKKA